MGRLGALAVVAVLGTMVLYAVGVVLLPPARPPATTVVSEPDDGTKHAARPAAVDRTLVAVPDEVENEPEAPDPVIAGPAARPGVANRGIVILQIGDSHTAADFMTGELRRQLQARYGMGAPGYVTAGRPHAGVRHSIVSVAASKGWSYRSLQRSESRAAEFWLSGYSSVATGAGETMTFTADQAITFEMIEIEVIAQPDGGAVEIRLDGRVEGSYNLKSARTEPVVIRMMPEQGTTEHMRALSIVTVGAGTVSIGGIAIHNRRDGITYHSIGYVGATVGLLNRFDRKLLTNALERIAPDIVVLAFGTNEATDDSLDLAAYGRSFERAVNRIKAAQPKASIVVISPPDFNVRSSDCGREKIETGCGAAPIAATGAKKPGDGSAAEHCSWRSPAKLGQVREVQHDIARRLGIVHWNWASIMPRECGAHQWFRSSPPLMSKDHMHFTVNGYRKSAEEFLNVLGPLIEKVRAGAHADAGRKD